MIGSRRASWESLHALVLRDVFSTPPPTMRDVPRFLAAGVRHTFVHALRGLHSPNPAAGVTAERAWKLFLLVPRLLLTRPRETGAAGCNASKLSRLGAGASSSTLPRHPQLSRSDQLAVTLSGCGSARARRSAVVSCRARTRNSPVPPWLQVCGRLLYLVTTPARARPALDDVTRAVEQHAGVTANLGKTRPDSTTSPAC